MKLKSWKVTHKEMTKEGLKQSFHANLQYRLAKDRFTTTARDRFMAFALAVADRVVERWIDTQQEYHKKNKKRVYYLSMEFLIGRLLGSNLLNLGLWEEAEKAAKEMGINLKDIRREETDAGLGNGGLGRLAACFLDSLATLGIPAHGYGIRYDYGIFHQKIVNGHQIEMPDEWLKNGNPWEFERPEYAVRVRFYGDVETVQEKNGKVSFRWVNTEDVVAIPFDIPVPGYRNDKVNTLRLWSATSSEEFDFEYFNDGDYEKAVYHKMYSENISKVLYPNDSSQAGRQLRLKQEYFFTAASIADIFRRFKAENTDVKKIPEKIAIQLNDTHPALAVAEFMRILLDQENIEWETAWKITKKTFAYTNHTVLPEALEKWKVSLLERLLPRHAQIIFEINRRFLEEVRKRFSGDENRVRRMSLIEESDSKYIRMAYLAILGSHSVNGVSKLHSSILKTKLFKDYSEMFPRRFNNKTNGIAPRRWLMKANPGLSKLISKAIGDSWMRDFDKLRKLEAFKKDTSFRKEWQAVKNENKKGLARYIHETMGIKIDPNSIFDVQVKRIHEYKRQVLMGFYVISEYLKLKSNPGLNVFPRTFIFSGKAAPGYMMAKLIIRFINGIAEVVNQDKTLKDKLKVVFLENYRVSLAEKIFPASDVSEQISTAGTEASGTGCMKFMMNGALTLGTRDGANIEMAEAVGEENMFLFGLKIDEVEQLKEKGYDPKSFIGGSQELLEILDIIRKNVFCPTEPGTFEPLVLNLTEHDPFLVCADFEQYCRIQEKVSGNYLDNKDWVGKAIVNVANSTGFSSDRTISDYARDIWKIPVNKRR